MRAIASSRARQAYPGLGENAVALTRPVTAVAYECDWPIAMWQAPISADELRVAEARFGDSQADLVTGAAFNDAALLKSNDSLDQYRVLHFATHGLVTAPRPDARRGRRWSPALRPMGRTACSASARSSI